jgi:site-specific recombinase XerD
MQPDLAPAIPIFLRRLHADSTRRAYAREISRFLAWLAENAPLDAEVLPRYVESLRARSLSSTFIAWCAVVVASFLRDCHRQGVLPRDLTEGYKPPRGTRGFAPRCLTGDELRRLLRTPDRRSWTGKRDLAALVCLGIGGLRAGEVTRLRMGDVEVAARHITLRVRGKGDRIRVVAFEGRNAEPLRAWAKLRGDDDAEGPFLLARRGGVGVVPRGLTVATLDYVVRRTARAAGLDRVHAHALRHSAASLALAGGASLVAVREMLGHSSVVTTSRYLHTTPAGRPATSLVTGLLS